MLNNLLRTFAILLFIPMLGFASNNPVSPEVITITANSTGEIVEVVAKTVWNSGSLNSHYLDFAHTQKNFDNIELEPGVYEYKVITKERNDKKGKMNLDIIAKFQGSSNSILLDRKINSTSTKKGSITILDFKSKSGSGSLAGYGKIKVHVGRAGANTNLNYSVQLRRTGNLPCKSGSIGAKSGTVVGNTLGKLKSSSPACKNSVKVKVQKTGGRAKTTIYVYASPTKNGSGTLKKTYEFPNGNSKSTKTLNVSGVNGKYIRVELKNRSAANTFKYSVKITQ